MPKDVTFLQSHDLSVEEMQVRNTYGGPSYLNDHVVRFGYVGDRCVNHTDVVRTKPSKCFHSLAIAATFIRWGNICRRGVQVLNRCKR